MLGSVYKDIICNKVMLILMASLTFGLTVFMDILIVLNSDFDTKEAPGLLLAMVMVVFIVFRMSSSASMGYDERKKYGYYMISTPDGVRTQVGAKYIFAFLTLLGWFVISNTLLCLSSDILGLNVAWTDVLAPMFFIGLFLNAVDMPFFVAFTSQNGGKVKAGILLALIFIGVVYALFGDLTPLKKLGDTDFNIFELLSGEKAIAVVDVMAAASVVLYYISYRISLKLYKKGVQRYEK